MPQIVPAGLYSPDTYSVYAENFDLSLLPTDGEVPLSPQSQISNQQPLQSPDYIPATIFHDPPIKLEKTNWSNLQFTSDQQFQYNNPLASQSQEPFITVFPPSPTPSIDYTQTQFNIKQEYMDLLPPSPPDSNCAPSPRSDIKSENDFDTETCIDIDSLLQRSFEAFEPKKQDHQLLREYLLDTSFQRKHNLKPLELESLFGGWGNRGDIEPVISLALEHAKKDVEQTCAALNISPGKCKILFLLCCLSEDYFSQCFGCNEFHNIFLSMNLKGYLCTSSFSLQNAITNCIKICNFF